MPERMTVISGMDCRNRNAYAGIPSSGRRVFSFAASASARDASRLPLKGSMTHTEPSYLFLLAFCIMIIYESLSALISGLVTVVCPRPQVIRVHCV